MNADLYNTIVSLASANNHNSDSIEHLIAITKVLADRVVALETKVKELESPSSVGNGAGHYGAGPWG
jgi:hypothetical protein